MATQAQTKISRITRRFKSESDPEGKSARTSNDVTHIIFTTANGKVLEIDLKTMFGGSLPPVSVGRAAAGAGVSNAVGGAGLADDVNTDDPDEVMEAMVERNKALSAGRWTAEHRGGGRPSLVWLAFVEWRKSKGNNDNEAKLAALRAQWFENEDNFKAMQKNAEFAVYLANYKAKNAKPSAGSATADLLA